MNATFVTGIGTNVGKTIVSAILCEALQADYWKPVQSGIEEGRDIDTVRSLISNTKTVFHHSAYELKLPASANIAADAENVKITLEKLEIPRTENHLIIEGAGGLLVPISDDKTFLDFVVKNNLSVAVVISSYLGCINHSLLTFEVLQKYNVPVRCAVLNGNFDSEVEKTLKKFIFSPFIKIAQTERVDKDFVSRETEKIRKENIALFNS
ncbi:MAG TPA: dethiobiotin synthase [Chitinophagales bacterium]